MEFNSSEYRWKDLTVVMLGRPLVRVLEVRYKTSVVKEVLRGRGSKGLGIQEGNEDVSGSIKIGQSELIALEREARQLFPGFKATDIPPFNLICAYERNGILTTDVVVSCSFNEYEKAMSQGATSMEIDMPFVALDVEPDKTAI